MDARDKKELLKKFSTEVRKARNRLDLTQADMASESGLSVRGYQKIETGEADPQLTTVASIASVLNTPLSVLLGRETTADLIVNILSVLPALNEKQLKSIIGLIDAAIAPVTNTRL